MDPHGWADRVREAMRGLEEAPAPASFLRYDRLEKIGEGAAAEVYRAVDRTLGRPVAVKILKGEAGLHENMRKRFQREAQSAARLSHPNVVAVHDAGEAEGKFYLVMDLVDGKPLSQVLEGRLQLRDKVALLEKVAQGVAAAHTAGIIHRDLKPGNILVTRAGEPKVSDFGLAYLSGTQTRLTRTGAAVGTPLYMAPEQAAGRADAIGPRTDVYALGAILYEMLTGRPPHVGLNVTEVYAGVLAEDPEAPRKSNPDLPWELEAICLKALEKEPSRRYQTAAAFGEDLARWLRGEPVAAKRTSRAYRLYRKLRRNPVGTGLAGLAAAAVLAAFLAWAAAATEAGRIGEERRAQRERLAKERAAALELMRSTARLSLEATLQLRRAGMNEGMRKFLSDLEEAYRRAVERAPELAEVEYLMGRMHRALMQDGEALEYQERALKKDPRFAPALYARILLLSRICSNRVTHLIATAEREARDILAAKGGARREEARIAATAELIRRDSMATSLLRRIEQDCAALEEQPDALGPGLRACARGVAAIARRESQRAIEELHQAARLAPELEEAYETLSQHYFHLGRPEDAVSCSRQGIERDRGYLPHYKGLGLALIAIANRKSDHGEDAIKEYQDAVAALETVVRNRPAEGEAWRDLGNARMNWGIFLKARGLDPVRHLESALADYTQALALDSGNAESWLYRGANHLHLGQSPAGASGGSPVEHLDRAIADFSEAITRDPLDARAWQWRGGAHMNRALHLKAGGGNPLPDLRQAAADVDKAIGLNPSRSEAWLVRGHLYLNWAQTAPQGAATLLERAIADYGECIKLDPDNAEGWMGRAGANLVAGGARKREGGDGAPFFLQAARDTEKCLGLNAANAGGWRIRALAFQNLVDGRPVSRAEGIEMLNAIIQSAENAVRLNPPSRGELEPILEQSRKHLRTFEKP